MEKYYFDALEAQRVIDWIEEYCTHVKGALAEEPFLLDEWQKDIVRNAYGWKRTKDNDRRYQIVYVELPRGNGKSTFGSALAVYSLVGDKSKAAEVYCVAGSKDQATMVFTPSKFMVLQNEDLKGELKVLGNAVYDRTGSGTLKVISADSKTAHGANPTAIFLDELHVQPNSELYDTLVTGMSKRANVVDPETGKYPPYAQNSIMFMFTTAGQRETFAHEMHEYALQVRDGIIEDESFLPIIFAAPKDADPFDPKTWAEANPGWNFINQTAFEQMANRAKNQPSFLNTFKRLHLNQWTGTSEAWIPYHEWDPCNQFTIDIEELKGKECYGGLDLAMVRDLCSLALYFPNIRQITVEGEKRWVDCMLWWFWCPEEQAHKETSYSINYSKWVSQGLITPTPGTSTDFDIIKDTIIEFNTKFHLVELSYDPQFAYQMATQLEKAKVRVNPNHQNYADYTAPMQYMEQKVLKREINHAGNPVMNWQMSNVQVQVNDKLGTRPSKRHSKGKIDGVAAGLMAISSYLDDDNKHINSVYEGKGITVL